MFHNLMKSNKSKETVLLANLLIMVPELFPVSIYYQCLLLQQPQM